MEYTLPTTGRARRRRIPRWADAHRRVTRFRMLLALPVMLLLAFFPAGAQLSNYYQFSTTPGTYTPLSGGNVVIASSPNFPYNETNTAGPFNIGFNFVFNGTTYSQFTLNARGFVVLGTTLSSELNNALENPSVTSDPVIAPFWDQQHLYDGSATCIPSVDVHVSYLMTGSAPNRVLNVEGWTNLVSAGTYYYGGNCLPMCTYQVRLFECSNRIEFQYGLFRISTNTAVHSTASIGLALGAANYISVTPGIPTTASSVSVNNNVDNNNVLSSTLITEGTIYAFSHITPDIVGRIGAGNGGTSTMANGDSLLRGFSSFIGNSVVYQPFNLSVPIGGCTGRAYSLTITGPAASDYYFTTPGVRSVGGVVNNGSSITRPITFSPTGPGLRIATLTYYDSTNRISRSFILAATGTSRMSFTGNIAQGGTTTMAIGDTLLKGKFVIRGTSQSFTPFTVTNISVNPEIPPANVSYTVTDPTGQYSISPASAVLGNGQSSTPSITFNATGVGPQPAKLTVNADGEIRTYVLYAVSSVPSAVFRVGTQVIDSTTTFYTKDGQCVGEEMNTYAIDIENNGGVPVVVTGLDVFATDTTFAQGAPRYKLRRDAAGNPIRLTDYFFTLTPPTLPITDAQKATFPILVPITPTPTRVYLTFVGARPQRRFARLFIRTNALNFSTTDENGILRDGLLRVDVFGRSTGSSLSDNGAGGLPHTVNFATSHIGDSVDASLRIFNTGACPLRVSLKYMDIVSGDVDEFSIVRKPTSNIDPVTGDLLLAPGANDVVTIRFKPRQMGSRRAGLRLMTNDSTIQIPGITERGVYYVDLYGNGKADVYADDADFGVVLIGGTGAELSHRSVRLKNTLNGPIVITKVIFDGTDVSEFTRDAATTWPQLPLVLNGGQEVNFGVVFGPVAGGQPGPRQATLKIITANGDTIVAHLTGIAGTRTITVNPTSVNFGSVTTGKMLRRTITIMNTGTMPLTLQAPLMSPGSDFTAGSLPRLVLAPGQTEYLELTYSPQITGGSNATLTILSNATNGGSIQVNLVGTALKTKLVGVDPNQSVTGMSNNGAGQSGTVGLSVSGVENEEIAGGMRLWQSVPNPAREQAEIRYSLAKDADIRLELFDAAGRLVKVLDAGHRGAGEQRVIVDLREQPNGAYHYRLSGGGVSLSRSLDIVR